MNSVRAYFVLLQTYKEFPDDEKFAAAFVTRDIYNMRQRNFILRHLEEHENKVAINIENFTIEHIMPQNSKMSAEWQAELGSDWKEIQKKYLHTIGNLTLTAYNSEMSDHSFMEKMDMDGGFKQSALRLNKYVVMQTEWKEAQIQERAKHLAAKATKIWKYPTISKASLASYQIEDSIARAEAWIEEEKQRRLLAEENIQLSNVIAEQKPKIEYVDKILQSPKAIPITVIAQDYGMTCQQMNQLLKDLGIQYLCSGSWILKSQYRGRGYTDSETKNHENNQAFVHTKWTQKGRLFLYEKLKNAGYLPMIEQ